MKIFCLAMNYPQHNKMLHGTLDKPEKPVIFCKPDSALLKNGKPFFVPDDLGRIEYEGELVVRICRLGKSVPVRFAHRYYDAFTVGVDFTARELQAELKKNGLPWELSKGFDNSAAIGEWIPKDKLPEVSKLRFKLDVNGQTIQDGCGMDMFFNIDETISYISRWFTLKTGDLLFTGCPVGCAAVNIGDHVEGYIEEHKTTDFWCR